MLDENTIAKLAYAGTRPESALPHEWLLWYRLRDIYSEAKAKRVTEKMGRAAKQLAVNSFRSEQWAWERNVLFWKRIEAAATEYAKSDDRTPAGDALFEAVYGTTPTLYNDKKRR